MLIETFLTDVIEKDTFMEILIVKHSFNIFDHLAFRQDELPRDATQSYRLYLQTLQRGI
jgi:hypothetical protein